MRLERADLRRIMVAVNEIEGACALLSKKIGVKENTLTLLYALDDGKPHSQKEICEAWFLPKTTLNTIVKECVEDGLLVLREMSGSREKALCLTEKGLDHAERVLPPVYEAENRAMESAGLTPELARSLSCFAQNLKKEARDFHHGA